MATVHSYSPSQLTSSDISYTKCKTLLWMRCRNVIWLVRGSARKGVEDQGMGEPPMAILYRELVNVLKYMKGALNSGASPMAHSG